MLKLILNVSSFINHYVFDTLIYPPDFLNVILYVTKQDFVSSNWVEDDILKFKMIVLDVFMNFPKTNLIKK